MWFVYFVVLKNASGFYSLLPKRFNPGKRLAQTGNKVIEVVRQPNQELFRSSLFRCGQGPSNRKILTTPVVLTATVASFPTMVGAMPSETQGPAAFVAHSTT